MSSKLKGKFERHSRKHGASDYTQEGYLAFARLNIGTSGCSSGEVTLVHARPLCCYEATPVSPARVHVVQRGQSSNKASLETLAAYTRKMPISLLLHPLPIR